MPYQRMYETRNVRPYYTISHLGIFGKPFEKLVGFAYKHIIYITSPQMNNAGYFDVGEMKQASRHFARLWQDQQQTRRLLQYVRKGFRNATTWETWAWQQQWQKKTDSELVHDAVFFDGLLMKIFGTMIISQPQHVSPLEEVIIAETAGVPRRADLIKAATEYSGDLPWAGEEREIARLHKRWPVMSKKARQSALQKLVKTYGWFNTIEGDEAFDEQHYREKIKHYTITPRSSRSARGGRIVMSARLKRYGRLIGELGYLRFWNRYHFMHIRFHLDRILTELVQRSGRPLLAYATTAEIVATFRGRLPDLSEIARRKNGYTSVLVKGVTKIYTGLIARKYRNKVREHFGSVSAFSGTTANAGVVTGKVRVISFSARDYHRQVTAFKKGEILVTGMTRPQIVHLCNKAAGIITDEGGITSHAAVVSRELDLPCIINTRNATKILRTGDLVRLDADTAQVKIIKRF